MPVSILYGPTAIKCVCSSQPINRANTTQLVTEVVESVFLENAMQIFISHFSFLRHFTTAEKEKKCLWYDCGVPGDDSIPD